MKIFKTYHKFPLLLLLVLGTIAGFSQERKTKYADKLFRTLQYKEAAEEYERLYEKGVVTVDLYKHLGDSYYYNTDMRSAYTWYSKLIESNKEENRDSISPEYYFRYAHTLQGLGRNKEAKKWMKKFSRTTSEDDLRKQNYLEAKNELDQILQLNANYEVFNVTTNTEYSDFGVGYYGEEVVFASSTTKNKNPEIYHWNNQPYLDLFKGFTSGNFSDIETAKLFSEDLNTEYHESNAVFTKDLKKVYFTRNNFQKRLKDDGEGVNHLKLYSADVEEDRSKLHWVNIEELPFNSDEYSVGHPALSENEKQLYFTSDMPGAIGGTDIFVVDVLGNNEYSEPKNLGNQINTSGREMFPFVMNETLYFASDGHLGFGGLDLFKSNKVDSSFGISTNMGKPINSPKDDFAFVFNEDRNSGFLSSNRKGGKGDDDIYTVIPVEKGPICEQGINGLVTNLVTQERIANANLELFNEVGKRIAVTTSNDIGQYDFKITLDCNSRYEVKVAKQGYKSVIKPTLTESITGNTFLPLAIETLEKIIVEEDGLLKLKIGIIYFDLDKDFVRNDAAVELDKIVIVMKQYKAMHINIESHTDSRSPFDYNKNLSSRRAKNTKEYIVAKGIDASRIESAIGYGEKRLINRCADGVKCSEAEHQLNRRSEFIITKM